MSSKKNSLVIGVDLGGTKIAAALVNLATGEVTGRKAVATDAARGFGAVLETLLTLVEEIRTPAVTAVGVGVPGIVDADGGHIVRLPNIPGAEGVDLAAIMQAHLDLPVVVGNDAQCFALAEALHGAGKGHDPVVGITLGTGVGGGIVVGGKLFRGAHGFAGEVGHALLVPGQSPVPGHGPRGEVEQFLSGTALAKRCSQAEKPEDLLDGAACEFLHPHVIEELAWFLASLGCILDPAIIVLGGSVGKALKQHLPALAEQLKRWLPAEFPVPPCVIAKLKDPGVLGAALITKGRF